MMVFFLCFLEGFYKDVFLNITVCKRILLYTNIMLQHISHILYFLLGAILLAVLVMSSLFPASLDAWWNIIYIYTILLLPFIVYIYDIIDVERPNYSLQRWSSVIVFAILLLVFGVEPIYTGFLVLLYASVVVDIDSRLSFLLALICFLYVFLYLLMSDSGATEQFSIYAYYFLIIWVVSEWIKSFILPKILR